MSQRDRSSDSGRSVMNILRKRIQTLLLCSFLSVSLIAGCASAKPSGTPTEKENADSGNQTISSEALQVKALKVGKADAIILTCGGSTMLIDCGEEDDGQEVVDNLTEQGVEKVDVLIITHFDKDHVGGADSVVKMMPVDRVLQPAYEGTSAEYGDFLTAMEEAGITPENVTQTQTIQLGNASVTVEPPASYEIPEGKGEYDNNFSLITTVELGAKRLVFAGDAEKKRIQEWLVSGTVQPCDFLKVPHHGVYNKALPELFEALQPAYAVICDSAKNPADDRTLELLKQCGASTYETKDGDISIVCDGESIAVTQ